MLLTPMQMGLMMKGSHGRPPGISGGLSGADIREWLCVWSVWLESTWGREDLPTFPWAEHTFSSLLLNPQMH